MPEEAIQNIPHNIESESGEAYREKLKREEALFEASKKGVKRAKPIASQTQGASVADTMPDDWTCVNLTQPTVQSPTMQNTITIVDTKTPVSIAFTSKEPATTFSVSFKAASVDITEDSISLLTSGETVLSLPSMAPLKVTVGGAPYSVIFVGGTHTIGPFRNISFIRITQQD